MKRYIRGYFSHPIRGEAGVVATKEEMINNCEQAVRAAEKIRKFWGPALDLYVPAEHQEILFHLLEAGNVTHNEIVECSCLIVADIDLFFLYLPGPISAGQLREQDTAKHWKKNIIVVDDAAIAALSRLC